MVLSNKNKSKLRKDFNDYCKRMRGTVAIERSGNI